MTGPVVTFGPGDPARRRQIGLWLAIWAGLLLLLVVIGGVTRLTEAGLSITEWQPVSGVLPPLSHQAWQNEFTKYQTIPEFRLLHSWMTLGDFQRIYLTEYIHRLWARLLGVAFAVPLLVFALRRGLGGPLTRRLVALLVLMGLQGAMGWYMVKSGLAGRTSVSQYRLAAHLALALVIFAVTLWTAADLLRKPASGGNPGLRGYRRAATGLSLLVFVNAIAGAFVAGLRAGKVYNTFPLMGDALVPAGYGQLTPWYLNWFENAAAVQFNHRLLGIAIVLAAVGLWWAGRRRPLSSGARWCSQGLAWMGVLQVGLGVATLLLVVPIALAAVHQAGAVILLALTILLVHALGEPAEQQPG
ncbi:MAG TPA: COX15/CtaA family protein [Gemmatimonadales bacterium]|nr:COX15/CtaA family protein [Gemmatimonadales bacterium]